MKKIIAFIGSNFCYYLGSFFGVIMNIDYLDFFYKPYNRLMTWSFIIQDWGGLKKPWTSTEYKNDEEL
jgi:hypothetical protein